MSENIQALLHVCNQVGPDDFEMTWHSRTFSKSATIDEIEQWAKAYSKNFSILNVKFATNDKAERGK
jgi:hypothetical protein